jgi:DNA invertase Pin-like site-specific DNA recombinase
MRQADAIRATDQATAAKGHLIGYACVSTEEQGTNPQRDESRGSRVRRDPRTCLRRRSVLAWCCAILEAEDANFRSLRDPIDTTTPQGMFWLQVRDAVARLERALIAERSKAGLHSAHPRPSARHALRVTRRI